MISSQRVFVSFEVTPFFKRQLLSWATRFGSFCFLDSHDYRMPGGIWDCAVGAGAAQECSPASTSPARPGGGGALAGLEQFHRDMGDWIFGHLGFDLKAETEGVRSNLPDYTEIPTLYFFRPLVVVLLRGGEAQIGAIDRPPEAVMGEILAERPEADPYAEAAATPTSAKPLKSRITRDEYLATVERLKGHIRRGDCYEINFCQEFFVENAGLDPRAAYRALSRFSPNPGAAFYSFGDHYLLCASPERYLQCRDGYLLSQPVKGTARRDLADEARDGQAREALRAHPKERSEHVMIVDLVRNDLSKVCRDVHVEEREGIYAFPQVFQMISSVRGTLEPPNNWMDSIRATFPMGSMTGAPKKRVLELIDRYEKTRRGLYSGSVGYVDPSGNFDFNVVIRSILYNARTQYLSFSAGSAITAGSDPEKEYEECLLKAAALQGVLGLGLPAASAAR